MRPARTGKRKLVRLAIAVLAIVAGLASASPSNAITEEEVEAACSRSLAALDEYQQARADFAAASQELEQINLDLNAAETRKAQLDRLLNDATSRAQDTAAAAEEAAIQLYMKSISSGATTFLSTAGLSELILASTVIENHTRDELAAIDNLTVLKNELDRLEGEAAEAASDLEAESDRQAAFTTDQQAAMAAASDAYAQLDDECKELQSEYQAEQARLRTLEEQRQEEAERQRQAEQNAGRGGGSGGGTGQGIVCPFDRGRTQFIDSWGYPRSGGRSHQGTDMMAPWDVPVYAVEAGTILESTQHGIGGKHIWLRGQSGTAYYYAHLNSLLVGEGASVAQGKQIGTNGNSGNAAGGAPHVHLQVHPSGRGGPAINPYPRVASVCF